MGKNIFGCSQRFFHVLHQKLLMLEICLLFETFHLNHLSTNPVHLQGKTCRVENERKIKSRPSGFFSSFKLLYISTWPSKYFSTNSYPEQCLQISFMIHNPSYDISHCFRLCLDKMSLWDMTPIVKHISTVA